MAHSNGVTGKDLRILAWQILKPGNFVYHSFALNKKIAFEGSRVLFAFPPPVVLPLAWNSFLCPLRE
jgi:hypothetical protein